jgi:hypothetical protein
MSIRSLFFLLLFLLAVFLIVKFDCVTKVKVGVTNAIYGDEVRRFKGFKVVVEPTIPELEREGLTRTTIRQGLIEKIEKAGIRSFSEGEWQETPGRPVLNVTVQATKTADGRYQYAVVIEVSKSDDQGPGSSEKFKTLWATYDMGEGDVSDIRAKITEEMGLFLKTYKR